MLVVKDGSDNFDRRAFVRFNLGELRQPVSRATLRLAVAGLPNGSPAPVKLLLAADGWDEYGVTWKTQPALGEPIASASVDGPGEITFDVTSYVNARIGHASTITFALVDDTTARLMVRFSSRETMSPPELLVSPE